MGSEEPAMRVSRQRGFQAEKTEPFAVEVTASLVCSRDRKEVVVEQQARGKVVDELWEVVNCRSRRALWAIARSCRKVGDDKRRDGGWGSEGTGDLCRDPGESSPSCLIPRWCTSCVGLSFGKTLLLSFKRLWDENVGKER